MNRRGILLIWASGLLKLIPRRARSAVVYPDLAPRPSGHPARGLDSLPAFIDTLLPEYLGPSGSQLAVPEALVRLGQADSEFQKILVLGCQWLDRTAQKNQFDDFSKLPDELRVAVVTAAERADHDSDARQFFEHVRRHAFAEYYVHAKSWAYLSYGGPPQPAGFMDHAHPPRRKPN